MPILIGGRGSFMYIGNAEKEDGFSLIEIMVGLVIFGILVGISVMGYQKLRSKGNQADLQKEVSSAQLKIETYWTGAQKLYPVASSSGIPIDKNNVPVYENTNKKMTFNYSVSKNRKDYCIAADLRGETFYFKKSVGEKSSKQTC